MKNLIQEYLTFSNREKKGVLVLLFLIATMGLVPAFIENFKQEEQIDVAGFEKEIRQMEAQLIVDDARQKPIKYHAKGSYFKRKEEFKKIYLKQKEIPLFLNLNTADSAALTLLKGIGPAYAARIIKYRNILGGFIDAGQLREVYGLDSSLYALIEPHVFARDSGIKKININAAGIEEFRKHPYFGYRIARALVNYRLAHGPFKNVEDLKAIILIPAYAYNKIEPYITTE
jgi:competence ComEA-like helix-hairpin-helix protein